MYYQYSTCILRLGLEDDEVCPVSAQLGGVAALEDHLVTAVTWERHVVTRVGGEGLMRYLRPRHATHKAQTEN